MESINAKTHEGNLVYLYGDDTAVRSLPLGRKEAEAVAEEREDAKSYYYPPDEDEPQEIRDMEEKFRQAVEVNMKQFGTPVFQYSPGVRGLSPTDEEWDMMAEARPLDISHQNS